jgi:hypothetical protein
MVTGNRFFKRNANHVLSANSAGELLTIDQKVLDAPH